MMIDAAKILRVCLDILAFLGQLRCFFFCSLICLFGPLSSWANTLRVLLIARQSKAINILQISRMRRNSHREPASGWGRAGVANGRERERARGGERVRGREWREEDLLSIVHVQFLCEFVKIDTAIRAA